MIRASFLSEAERQTLVGLARNGLAEHRIARRANAIILLDIGWSCAKAASALGNLGVETGSTRTASATIRILCCCDFNGLVTKFSNRIRREPAASQALTPICMSQVAAM
jgi:hypothetical protein